jgi:hypothetical protein
MFRDAYKIASEFTLPVIISGKTASGECSSAIGAFVVINEDGWIVTAAHILALCQKFDNECTAWRTIQTQREAIQSDSTLTDKEKRKQISKLNFPPTTSTEEFSIFWGIGLPTQVGTAGQQVQLQQAVAEPEADLAVGRLQPFDPTWVKTYPVFKDPTRNFDHGVSLMKVGFPFHSIVPTWDATGRTFMFPAGALPVPRFPIEGIFTRICQIAQTGGSQFPIRFVETSTPGLRGQSGGPTVDTQGTVWAIQSRTLHLPLGFDPEVPGKPGQREHQFINVGHGVHPDTMFGLFQQVGLKYQVSNY